MKPIATIALLLAALTALSGSAQAGPPCICWPIEIGDLPSLPADAHGNPASGYDPARACPDALRLLDSELPALARMETLRRATLYLTDEPRAKSRLLTRLLARALDAEAKGGRDRALAWFDAGYFVSCLQQMGDARDLDGYSWIRRGVALGGDDPALHFGAALVTLMGDHPAHTAFEGHVRAAESGRAADPLLEANLKTLAKLAPAVLDYFASRKK